MAAFNMQRRPSSWFGPQFRLESFSLPSSLPSIGYGSFASSRGSISRAPSYSNEPRRSSNLKTSMPKLPMPEPLFQDSYLSSEDDISPSTPDPKLSCLWGQEYKHEYIAQSETLEDLGLVMDADDCKVVATYVSIVNLGKPKVVDILPSPMMSRDESPRPQIKPQAAARPPIVWRMPSYDSTTRTSEMSYVESERSESLDSRSTYPSSISDGPKTPGSFSDYLKVTDSPVADPSCFPEPPPSRGSISRSSTLLRRHSRNLSASFSKAFLNRLREAETPAPALPSRQAPMIIEPEINYSLPYTATERPQTASSFGSNASELHMPPRPQHLAPLSRQAPVLRRKKSIAGAWF